MKKWFQPANKPVEAVDMHSEPTEPLPPLVLPPFASAPTNNILVPDEQSQPLVLSYSPSSSAPAPGDQQGTSPVNALQPLPGASYSPPVQSYPYPPPSPLQPEGQKLVVKPIRPWWQGKRVPWLVGICFVSIQLLLLLRLVLQIVNQTATRPWLDAIQGITTVLASPFYWLLQQVQLSPPPNTGVYVVLSLLVAILAYGLLSRIVVRLLKITLNWRKQSL